MPFYGQYAGFGAGGVSYSSLFDILTDLSLTTGLKLCLDAGDASSYTSGQQWLDTSGGGYDMDFGSSASAASDDPTFNGVAGGLSSAEYMSFDGGDYFEYETTNATWMNNIHKNNTKFTFFAFVFVVLDAVDDIIMGTDNGGGGGNTGFHWDIQGNETVVLSIQASGSQVLNLTANAGDTVITGGWHAVALSFDEATGVGGAFHWLDGSYNQVSASDTWDATLNSPSTGSASATLNLAASGSGVFPFSNGWRFAQLAAWEGTVLTKTNLDAIWGEVRGRFGV